MPRGLSTGTETTKLHLRVEQLQQLVEDRGLAQFDIRILHCQAAKLSIVVFAS
jgi:hypothetical protein